MLKPELKMIGGRKKLKNASLENWKCFTLLIPKPFQSKNETPIPSKMVTPVSWPRGGFFFSMYAADRKKKSITDTNVARKITFISSIGIRCIKCEWT